MNRTQQRLQAARACMIAFVCVACAFLWLAVLSFAPIDAPSPHSWPHPDPAENACGRAGAWIAYHLFVYFGKGTYAAVIALTLALSVLAKQGRLSSMWQRVLGIGLIIVVASAAAHLLTSASPSNWLEMRGGVLGYFVATWLQQSVKWMTFPILGYALVVGLLFTAEELMFKAPGAIRQRGEQIGEIAGNVRDSLPTIPRLSSLTAPIRRAVADFGKTVEPEPVLAGPGSRGGRTSVRDLKINPGRKPLKTADDNEEDAEEWECESEATDSTSTGADEATEVGEEEGEGEEWEYEEEGEEEGEVEGEWEDDVEGEEGEYEDESEETEDDDASDEPLAPEPKMIVKVSTTPRPSTVEQVVLTRPYPAELGEWDFPNISVLENPEYTFNAHQEALVRDKARVLERTLQEYRIEASVVEIDTGPVITMFELQAAPGIKVSQIATLSNDIARALKAPSIRVVAPIPGKNTIGIEVPNLNKEKVRLKELMTVAGASVKKMSLPLFLGKDASGGTLISDLTGMPHMLIAGTTGSGKSVCINAIITSLVMTQRPDMVKLILIDPKMVEMSSFRELPHLMCPIVTEMERAEKILEWATVKMDERYALLAEANVRNIAAYNRLNREEKIERFQPASDEERNQIPMHLPYIVVIIDELADMMLLSAKAVELHLSRLAQKSRAVGIHIIVATQRPEAKIVTGLIKSNLPCRIAFRVASRMDSRIVLDQNGAEVLMGQGDMLYLPPGSSKLIRAQGTCLEDSELKAIIGFLKEKGEPEFHPELIQLGKQEISADGPRDELFEKAVDVVMQTRRGSVSLLQRRLTIGYSRASRLIEEMAAAGIVGVYKGSQAREVLITLDEWETLKEQETPRIHKPLSPDESVPDMLYDDDI